MKPPYEFDASQERERTASAAGADAAHAITYRLLDRSFADQLQAVNRACTIAADFTIRFDREPDFFAWPDRVFEDFRYLGILAGDRLVGFCLGGFRTGWLGTQWGRFVYAGDARMLPEFRGHGYATQAALRIVTELETEVDVGTVLIKKGNRLGEHVLDRCRRTLGVEFEALGAYDVFSLPLLLPTGTRTRTGAQVRAARWSDIDEAAALLTAWGTGRLFAPRFDAEELYERWCSPGLGPERHLVVERAGRLVGLMGLGDMHDVRQVSLLHYAWTAAPIRAIYGIGARLRPGVAPLPRPGGALRSLVATDLAVADDDPGVLHAMLAAALNGSLGRGYHVLQIGFFAGDPLRPALRGFLRQRFSSAAHAVFNTVGAASVRAKGRVPHFDLSMV
jgi:hypothetical protein